MPNGLNLAALYNRVAVNVQDTDNTGTPAFVYWQKAWIVGWINDTVHEVCAEVQLLKQFVAFGQNPAPVLPSNPTAEYVPTYTGTGGPTAPDPENLDQILFLQAGQQKLTQVSV